MAEKQKPSHDVFSVEERGDGQKPFYRQLGACWPTKSGEGLNLVIHAVPLSGRLLLLPFKDKSTPSSDTE